MLILTLLIAKFKFIDYHDLINLKLNFNLNLNLNHNLNLNLNLNLNFYFNFTNTSILNLRVVQPQAQTLI